MADSGDALVVAKRFLAALNKADADAVREIYSPDAYIWHNFSDKTQSVEENIKAMNWLHRKLSDVDYEIIRLVEMLEDLDDVQNVYSNADISDEILEGIG